MLTTLLLLLAIHLSGVPSARADSWSRLAPMLSTRYGHAAAAGSDGRIYAIGGLNRSSSVLQTVEAYDPDSGNWTYVAPMPAGRYLLAAAAGLDGLIYVIGGLDNFNRPLSTAEVYDPINNMWSRLPSAPTARFSLAVVAGPDDRIYALGGTNSLSISDILNTVDAYTP